MTRNYEAQDLVLCTSPDGWSLHAPGSIDEDIASGEAPYIACGPGRPTEADYRQAFDRYLATHIQFRAAQWRRRMTYQIHDERLNQIPEQRMAASWDEMVAWAQSCGMSVGKRRTEWDADKARVLGITGNVTSYAVCNHQGGIRAVLVEYAE